MLICRRRSVVSNSSSWTNPELATTLAHWIWDRRPCLENTSRMTQLLYSYMTRSDLVITQIMPHKWNVDVPGTNNMSNPSLNQTVRVIIPFFFLWKQRVNVACAHLLLANQRFLEFESISIRREHMYSIGF